MRVNRMIKSALRIGSGLVIIFSLSVPQSTVYAATYTVTNTNDSGAGSLRQALLNAAAHDGADDIVFNIPTSDEMYGYYTPGVFTIEISSTLLISDDNTQIDGTTQAVYQGDTNPDGWEIEVYGGSNTFPIFSIRSDYNLLFYLSITGGSVGVDIADNSNWNTVNTNVIGLDGDKNLKVQNSNGVQIRELSDFNTLVGNYIAGNTEYGMVIDSSSNNNITRNYIGTNGSATNLGNAFGIYITGTSVGNVIGGSDSNRNVISCNTYMGVMITGGSNNDISYNHIGLNYAGTSDFGNQQSGIYVGGGADETSIDQNLISGNGEYGVYITGTGTDSTDITDNKIGTDSDNDANFGNGYDGVSVSYGPTESNIVGNYIMANDGAGVHILDAGLTYVAENYIGIGTDPTITALGNTGGGIVIAGTSTGTVIGGSEMGRNIISRNGQQGVWIVGSSGNEISYNFIGTDSNGTLDRGNTQHGIYICDGADGTTVVHNLISGNDLAGIHLFGTGVDGTVINSNKIGSNTTGLATIGNGMSGVDILGQDGSGGPTSSEILYNMIVGNTDYGVLITNSNNNTLYNNYIGTNWSDASTMGNTLDGVFISGTSTGNIIGGSDEHRNIISHNSQNGVGIDAASDNEVSYNYIGTGHNGSSALGNLGHGVFVTGGADDTTISNNLISGNNQHGIYINGSNIQRTRVNLNRIGSNATITGVIGNGKHGVVVQDGPTGTSLSNNIIVGNTWSGVVFQNTTYNNSYFDNIGVYEPSGLTSLGNKYYGIHIQGSFNTVFGSVVANNGITHPATGDGIRIDGTSYTALNNQISHVSIYGNGGKGIENINGGNNNLEGPELAWSSTCTRIAGSVPSGSVTVSIYSGPDDEGKTWIADDTSSPEGYFAWTGYIPGPYVSATWKDSSMNTSEFAAMLLPACYLFYLPRLLVP